MVWLVDEHSDEDIKQAAAGIPNLSGAVPPDMRPNLAAFRPEPASIAVSPPGKRRQL
jgi:hypothetical protein